MVSSSVTIVGSLVMMLRLSPRLVLVFAVTIPLALLLASYLTHMVQPMFRARSRAAGELNGYVEEMISGQKTLRAYTQEERVIQDMDVQNKKLVDAYYKTDYYASIMGPATNAINNLALALISVFGAHPVSPWLHQHRQHLCLRALLQEVHRAHPGDRRDLR